MNSSAATDPELLPVTEPFAIERNLTRLHRAHRHLHPALCEARCLRAQFPAGLSPIEAGDCFAGRWYRRAIVFSARPAGPELVGYSCHAARLQRQLEAADCDASTQNDVADCLAYWQEHGPGPALRRAYPAWLSERLPSDQWQDGTHPAAPLYRLAGLQLDFRKLVRLGLPGLRALVGERAAAGGIEPALVQAWQESLSLVADCAAHYAEQAEQAEQAESAAEHCQDAGQQMDYRRIAASCRAIRERAPQTLHEALQLVVLYKTVATVENWARMDDYCGPFLAADLDAGRIDQDEALRMLASLWRLIATTGEAVNERVIIGGSGRSHPAAADRFARLAIAATRQVHDVLPQLSLRICADQDPQLVEDALDALGAGCTFPILYDDAVNVAAVQRAFGVDAATAAHWLPFGCGEYVLDHRSVGTPSGIINCARVLELVLHDGCDPATGVRYCPGFGRLTDWPDFDSLWHAFERSMSWYLEALAAQQQMEYEHCARAAGYNLASLLMDDCIARGRSLLDGGVQHRGGTMESYGQITAADSLHVIDQLVFRSGVLTADELLAALAADFKSHEAVLARLRAVPHYGNDDAAADAMAVRVHELVCRCTAEQAAPVGLDSYLVVLINNGANVILGFATGASADGRRAGAPLNNGNNPGEGNDRSGLTALLASMARLDPGLHAGAVQNIKLDKELFRGAGRRRLRALLDTWFASGGAQAMVTVVSPADLEAAMQDPDQWGHLIVRVGGFSARFTQLDRDTQLHILNRTLHA